MHYLLKNLWENSYISCETLNILKETHSKVLNAPFAPILSWKQRQERLICCFLRLQFTQLDFFLNILSLFLRYAFLSATYKGCFEEERVCQVHKDHPTNLLSLKEFLLHAGVHIWLQLLWSCGTIFWRKDWQTDYILSFYKLMGPQPIFSYPFFFSPPEEKWQIK